MGRFMRRLRADRSGMSGVEFALMTPILLLLLAGTVDFGRLILITQKIQSGTFIVADLAARDQAISEDQIDNIFLALGNVAQPFDLTTRGVAHITSVTGIGGSDPEVSWQRTGAGGLAEPSRIGSVGDVATIPDDITLSDGETLIVSEVYYDYEPIFGLTFGDSVLRKVAYYRPRLGSLNIVAP